ncbi:MAG: 7-cyano-7-deazaguanine synthase [Verrucomicrobiota bacterium]|nr:7-cyano-7-deazaguanine synthase [Verrucomicrobiota bacterium]
MKKKAVLSLSGGMDSTGLLVHLLARGCRVYGISYDYGQKHKLELDRLKSNLNYLSSRGHEISHEVVDISVLGTLYNSSLTTEGWDIPEGHYEQDTMKQTVVPNRNAIFSSIAYGYALSIANKTDEDVNLCLGVHSGDHAIYPDCRPEFYDAIHQAFTIGNWDSERVYMYLPYLNGDKYTILKDAQESIEKLGLDFDEIFRNTNTSYNPDSKGRASGKTGADVERILAFHQLGVPDPVTYIKPWEDVLADALKLQQKHKQAPSC